MYDEIDSNLSDSQSERQRKLTILLVYPRLFYSGHTSGHWVGVNFLSTYTKIMIVLTLWTILNRT